MIIKKVNMVTSEDLVTYIKENYPNVSETTVAVDSAKSPFNEIIKRLFLDGYKIIASSNSEVDIDQLNRIMYSMSGSKFRYRYAPFSNIYKEPTTVLVSTGAFIGDSQYAKEVIRVTETKPQGNPEPIKEAKATLSEPKRPGRPRTKQ
jgi:hypothetical protein